MRSRGDTLNPSTRKKPVACAIGVWRPSPRGKGTMQSFSCTRSIAGSIARFAIGAAETRGVQTPLETLKLESGSCRDMATLLLEITRSLAIASRFASGYLDSEASLAGRAATHAWTEIYFPEHGWFGCDPTLGEETSQRHIVSGVSSHPRGVMPISGAYSGPTSSFLGMTVSVKIAPFVPPVGHY